MSALVLVGGRVQERFDARRPGVLCLSCAQWTRDGSHPCDECPTCHGDGFIEDWPGGWTNHPDTCTVTCPDCGDAA